jgi:hypothetical protein
MKKTIKRIALAALIGAAITVTATACTVWEVEQTRITPLPEVEIPITPEPWEHPPEYNPTPTGE